MDGLIPEYENGAQFVEEGKVTGWLIKANDSEADVSGVYAFYNKENDTYIRTYDGAWGSLKYDTTKDKDRAWVSDEGYLDDFYDEVNSIRPGHEIVKVGTADWNKVEHDSGPLYYKDISNLITDDQNTEVSNKQKPIPSDNHKPAFYQSTDDEDEELIEASFEVPKKVARLIKTGKYESSNLIYWFRDDFGSDVEIDYDDGLLTFYNINEEELDRVHGLEEESAGWYDEMMAIID